jgi:hypothetical protein
MERVILVRRGGVLEKHGGKLLHGVRRLGLAWVTTLCR